MVTLFITPVTKPHDPLRKEAEGSMKAVSHCSCRLFLSSATLDTADGQNPA